MLFMVDEIVREEPVRLVIDDKVLDGRLAVPAAAQGLVIFAHRGGSSRFSTRDTSVVSALWDAGLATLRFDLLAHGEAQRDAVTLAYRFDIGLLASRLEEAIDWAAQFPVTRKLPIGLFGASTGSAAAVVAAASRPDAVGAIVSLGGRPDLAEASLEQVRAPTLLVVGGTDAHVLELNWNAIRRMRCERYLEVVPRAGHLFEEPGALANVSALASVWFIDHLAPVALSTGRDQWRW